MKTKLITAALALACVPLAASAQFEQFKGKMKPGLYEYKMTVEMAGMPKGMPGMGAPMTMQRCLKAEDIEKGGFNSRENKMPQDCQVKDFKMSGNTATYKMECTGKMQMVADTKITFTDNTFVMDSTSTMNHGGQPMTSKSHMESKFLGPCQ